MSGFCPDCGCSTWPDGCLCERPARAPAAPPQGAPPPDEWTHERIWSALEPPTDVKCERCGHLYGEHTGREGACGAGSRWEPCRCGVFFWRGRQWEPPTENERLRAEVASLRARAEEAERRLKRYEDGQMCCPRAEAAESEAAAARAREPSVPVAEVYRLLADAELHYYGGRFHRSNRAARWFLWRLRALAALHRGEGRP